MCDRISLNICLFLLCSFTWINRRLRNVTYRVLFRVGQIVKLTVIPKQVIVFFRATKAKETKKCKVGSVFGGNISLKMGSFRSWLYIWDASLLCFSPNSQHDTMSGTPLALELVSLLAAIFAPNTKHPNNFLCKKKVGGALRCTAIMLEILNTSMVLNFNNRCVVPFCAVSKSSCSCYGKCPRLLPDQFADFGGKIWEL